MKIDEIYKLSLDNAIEALHDARAEKNPVREMLKRKAPWQ